MNENGGAGNARVKRNRIPLRWVKKKMSVVPSGYNNGINNKLVGEQEVIYVCVQTTGSTKIRYIKRRFIQCRVCKSKLFTA